MSLHKSRWHDGIALAVSCLLTLALLECSTRYLLGSAFGPTLQTYLTFEPTLGWRPAPRFESVVESRAKDFRFDVAISADGYRMDAGMQHGRSQKPDVIVLGDSHAFGFGLASEQTFASQLAGAYRKQGVERSVLNAGVPGYDILQPILRLGTLDVQPGTLVVFLVHPVNDLVNSANDIDYRSHKPFLFKENGHLTYKPPRRSFVDQPYHFSPNFDQLNETFGFGDPKESLLDKLTEWSSLVYVVRYRSTISRFRTDPTQEHILWDDYTSAELVKRRVESIKNDPSAVAARFWPEIASLSGLRQELILHILSQYRETRAELAGRGAKMLVVVNHEPYRNMDFYRALTDLLASLQPQHRFDWKSTRRALIQGLRREGIPILIPDYSAVEDPETLFVAFDGHTSAEAFEIIARDVAAFAF